MSAVAERRGNDLDEPRLSATDRILLELNDLDDWEREHSAPARAIRREVLMQNLAAKNEERATETAAITAGLAEVSPALEQSYIDCADAMRALIAARLANEALRKRWEALRSLAQRANLPVDVIYDFGFRSSRGTPEGNELRHLREAFAEAVTEVGW